MTENNISYKEKLIAHRRNLHMIPELDRNLPKTKAYLLSVLKELDCTLTFLCDSGICAFFDKGGRDTYGFRADMDALPVQETNICSYASTHNGAMHACGHDGHMSMVLTLAEYVNSAELKHNVLLIFQPAEETLGGAEEICKSGILAKHNVSRVFGIHLWPFLPKGKISSKPGAFMPKSAEINIDIYGKAAHGTAPYEGKDALYISADFINRAYAAHGRLPGAIPHFKEDVKEFPSLSVPPEEKTLIHFGKMESGYARNIVSDYTHILGTVRAFSEENFNMIISLLKDKLNEISLKYQCDTEFSNSDGYPPVINDPALYSEIEPVLRKLRGGYEEMKQPLMISEDFSFYGLYAPSVFLVLGTGTDIPLHSTNFDFDESLLADGFSLYRALLEG